MSYEKHDWSTGEVISAENLNHLETGVEAAQGADWSTVTNKPFTSIGTGLDVTQGVLSTDIPTASTETAGLVKPDGSSITVTNVGVISANIPEQTQADWNQADSAAVDYIKNKPTIPAAQIQADWEQANSSAIDYIKNKPSIPAAQVQSDWNQANNAEVDFIKNKPNLAAVATSGSYADLSNTPGLATVATSGSYEDLLNKPTIPEATPIATEQTAGKVKPDGTTITITNDGTISSIGGISEVTAADINSESATDGQVLAADGTGGATWVTPQGGGGVQADWNQQNSAANDFIKNKPFYSEIGTMPGLPKTFIDGLGFTFEDAIDSLGISDAQWEQSTGVPRSDCFASTGAIINYEQAKDMYFYTGQGGTYPGDAAIIAEYGSVQAYGQLLASLLEAFLGKATYIGDFDYEPGELPDTTSLINPIYTAEINSVAVSDTPASIHESISLLGEIPTDTYDIWGNTGLYNGALSEVYSTYIGHRNAFSLVAAISPHINSDDYYFAIAKFYSEVAPGMVFNCYWYDLAFADSNYFTTSSVSIPVSHDWTTTSGAASDYQRYQVSAEKVNGKNPEITFSVSTDISTSISYGMYGYTNSSYETIPDSIQLNINNSNEYKYLQNSTTTPGLETGTFNSYDFHTNDKVNFTLNLSAEDSSAYAYIDVPDTWTVVTSITKSMGTTEFDYTLTSADTEIIHQLDNKFVPKPEWWFGEKKSIISETTHIGSDIPLIARQYDISTENYYIYGDKYSQIVNVPIEDIYNSINLDYSGMTIDGDLSGLDTLAQKDINGEGSITIGFIKIDGTNYNSEAPSIDISSSYNESENQTFTYKNMSYVNLGIAAVILGNGSIAEPSLPSTSDNIGFVWAPAMPTGSAFSVNSDVINYPEGYTDGLISMDMLDRSVDELLMDICEHLQSTECHVSFPIIVDITINEAYTASKLDSKYVDLSEVKLTPAGTESSELGGVYVPFGPLQVGSDGKLSFQPSPIAGDGLTVQNDMLYVANATNTTVGGIKARVNGDTLYITTNGTNP